MILKKYPALYGKNPRFKKMSLFNWAKKTSNKLGFLPILHTFCNSSFIFPNGNMGAAGRNLSRKIYIDITVMIWHSAQQAYLSIHAYCGHLFSVDRGHWLTWWSVHVWDKIFLKDSSACIRERAVLLHT